MASVYDAAVEKELMQNAPKLICAWHPRYFQRELVMREGPEPASHSICEECRAKFNDGVSVERRKNPIRGIDENEPIRQADEVFSRLTGETEKSTA